MTRRILTAAHFCFAAAIAQAKANLSGVGNFNSAASDYGPLPNKPEKIVMTVEQSGSAIQITQAITGAQKFNTRFKYPRESTGESRGNTLEQARRILVTQGEFDQTFVFDKQ